MYLLCDMKPINKFNPIIITKKNDGKSKYSSMIGENINTMFNAYGSNAPFQDDYKDKQFFFYVEENQLLIFGIHHNKIYKIWVINLN